MGYERCVALPIELPPNGAVSHATKIHIALLSRPMYMLCIEEKQETIAEPCLSETDLASPMPTSVVLAAFATGPKSPHRAARAGSSCVRLSGLAGRPADSTGRGRAMLVRDRSGALGEGGYMMSG